jgi:DTW domain-containing protein YfiP
MKGAVDRHQLDRHQRCQRCQRRVRRCICAYLCDPPLSHHLHLVLIQSVTERDHVKNSGALLAGSLVNAEIIEVKFPSHHQRLNSDFTLDQQLKHLTCSPYTLLYPPEQSNRESKEETQDQSVRHLKSHVERSTSSGDQHQGEVPQKLVILDLTWKQSTRLLLSMPDLASASRFSLTDRTLTLLKKHQLKLYGQLRTVNTQQHERCSTFEAGLAALIQYDYQTGQVGTLTEGLKRYDLIWSHYRKWIQTLSRQFKR